MIKEIKLTNFFSFREETIRLNSDTNICIGINGSGKSNLLKALTLLKVGVEGNQEDTALQNLVVSGYGGFDSMFCKTFEETEFENTIGLEFVFDSELLSGYGPMSFGNDVVFKIVLKRQGGQGNFFVSEKIFSGDYVYLEFFNGKGKVSERDPEFKRVTWVKYEDYNPGELSLSKISEFDKDRYLPLVILKRAIREISIYGYFDTSEGSKLRKSGIATSSFRQLAADGGNLVQILNQIKINHKKSLWAIQERLKDVNPNFKTFEFNVLGASGVIELMLEEKKLESAVHVTHISDGTLRFLCLLAILYNPQRGSLICIDEPEVGLHPDMIYNIAEAIKEAAKQTTIIVSTHSAELLNLFELSTIHVFEKNEFNSTIITQYSERDFDGWYDEFLPGRMWNQGDIGGKRW